MEGTEQEREDEESCGDGGLKHVAGKDEGSKPGAGPLFLYPPLAAAPGTCVLSQQSPRVHHLELAKSTTGQ